MINQYNLPLAWNAEPVFVNLLGSPGIDYQPGGIDSWAPEAFTYTGNSGLA
jgi:hypothetical protein